MTTAWLHALDARVVLTRLERTTLAVLTLLISVGVGLQHVRRAAVPPVDTRLFAVEARALRAATAVPEHVLAPTQDSIATVARADVAREMVAAKAMEAADGAMPARPMHRARKAAFTGRLNLNTASETALQQLPRVGPALAARIVAYRQANGGFRRPADLTNVKGIGDKTLEKLLPHVFV